MQQVAAASEAAARYASTGLERKGEPADELEKLVLCMKRSRLSGGRGKSMSKFNEKA